MSGIVFEVMQVQAFSTIDKDNPSYCNGYEPFTLSIDKISVNLRPIKLTNICQVCTLQKDNKEIIYQTKIKFTKSSFLSQTHDPNSYF